MKKRREKTAKKVKKHALLVKKSRFHMTKKRSGMKNSEKGKKNNFHVSMELFPHIESNQKKQNRSCFLQNFQHLLECVVGRSIWLTAVWHEELQHAVDFLLR